jgi:hypothetical protein
MNDSTALGNRRRTPDGPKLGYVSYTSSLDSSIEAVADLRRNLISVCGPSR